MALLVASALCLATAPLLMPSDYSVLRDTISESAAQSIEGAWAARLGFVLYGFAVLVLSALHRGVWPVWARRLHTLFGGFMLGAAAFSSRSWEPAAHFNVAENHAHSVCASGMGIAFALGVLLLLLARLRARSQDEVDPEHLNSTRLSIGFDVSAIAAATLLPMLMAWRPESQGLPQRLMFLVSYAWYVRAAFRP